MKICGLITEYNPFHNGHIHHMQEAKALTGADYLIVVMSGNYVQRGTPAIINKYERTAMALNAGADLVLELPVMFSTATAEIFATAAVNLLHQLGCVDYLCFGSELGDISPLKEIAEVLNNEPKSFSDDLKAALRTGMNFPSARSMALDLYFKNSIEGLSDILESPNNILGIEYIRALSRLNSNIQPITVKRWTTEYHGLNTFEDVASATAIRKMLYEENGIERITPYVSPYTAREFALQYGISTPVRANDFSMILTDRINMFRNNLTDFADFSPELSERVQNLLPDCYTFKEWASAIKTKAFTHTRINRALLHLILNIRESDMAAAAEEDYCLYARMLGFRSESRALLTEIKSHTALPLISKVADAGKILPPKALAVLQKDIYASDIYRNAVYMKFGTLLKDDYTAGIIKF